MKAFIYLPLLALSMGANAAPTELFTGGFAVSQWAIAMQSGTVDTQLAPASVRFVSADDGSGPSEQTMTIAAPADGTVSFGWAYATTDSAPVWDAFGFLLNGSFIPVSDDLGDLLQQGVFTYNVLAGDLFGFSAQSFDSATGAATTTVSAFRFSPVTVNPTPTPTPPPAAPEPSTWALTALGLAVAAGLGRRGAAVNTARVQA